MFLEAASKVTGIFLPSQARLVGKKTRFPSVHVLSGFLRSQGQDRLSSIPESQVIFGPLDFRDRKQAEGPVCYVKPKLYRINRNSCTREVIEAVAAPACCPHPFRAGLACNVIVSSARDAG
jgi:hypothetical protein